VNITTADGHVYVSLSRRNATQLIEALDKGYAHGIVRRCEDGTSLHVVLEEDADHYRDGRVAGPGLDRILS
jgi:hypothetical protein